MSRLRERQEWRFFTVLPKADRRLAITWWAVLIARGVLPAVFAITTGVLVAAVQSGRDLSGPLALTGFVFVALQVLGPVHTAVSANLGDRTAAWLNDRLATACVDPPGMGHLEDQELTADLTTARDFDLGIQGPPLAISMDFIAIGLIELIGGLSSAAVLAAFRWWAPIVLAGAWLATHWLLRESAVWRDRNTEEVRSAQRDSDYAYRLAVDPPAAKELRLFGLVGWTIERFLARRTLLHELQYRATQAAGEVGADQPRTGGRGQRGGVLGVGPGRGRRSRPRRRRGLRSGRRRRQHDRLRRAQLGVGQCRRPGRGRPAAGLRDGARRGLGADGRATAGRRQAGQARSVSVASRSRTRPLTLPVLEGFDLTIPAGSSLAIVGRNGSGKTTLAKLLCRLYDPQSGAIEVDGVDMRRLDLAEWRSRVAAVFQDFTRFELPLRDNVAPNGAPDDVIREALVAAGAADLAELDTVLAKGYEGGIDLSGGQWQRVALARALCAVRLGAGVVLLDEPTAQLDVRGEAEIFERILAATRQCTTILISHRFSTVRQAERICVVERGRVVELGSHEELIALGGRYRTMFDLQARPFSVIEGEEEVQYDVLA